jgi:hypothetical protein
MKIGGSLAYIAVRVNRYVRIPYIVKLMHCEIHKFICSKKRSGFADPDQVGRKL